LIRLHRLPTAATSSPPPVGTQNRRGHSPVRTAKAELRFCPASLIIGIVIVVVTFASSPFPSLLQAHFSLLSFLNETQVTSNPKDKETESYSFHCGAENWVINCVVEW
jgi:hypothetical protein